MISQSGTPHVDIPKVTIRFQFSRENALTSDLIAWFSHGGGFSHVDVVSGHGQLYGARSDRIPYTDGYHHRYYPAGVHMRGPDYAPFVRRVIFELDCTEQQKTAFWTFLWNQNGKPYDYLGILGIVRDKDFENPKAWFCSRLIFAALLHAGIIPRSEYIPDGLITPRDVALVISALGARVISC